MKILSTKIRKGVSLNKPLAILGIVLIVLGLLIIIFFSFAVYNCPAEYNVNGTIVGGCGAIPWIPNYFGVALVILGIILLLISLRSKPANPGQLKKKGDRLNRTIQNNWNELLTLALTNQSETGRKN